MARYCSAHVSVRARWSPPLGFEQALFSMAMTAWSAKVLSRLIGAGSLRLLVPHLAEMASL